MAWAQRHPLTASAYNIANYLFLGMVKSGLYIYRTLHRTALTQDVDTVPAAAEKMPRAKFPAKPSVLLVVEASIPQCFQYRVQQKLNMLSRLGWDAEWLPWSDVPAVERALHFHDVIVLYRVPGFPPVMSYIEYAKFLNKLLIYDLDDLVFDRQQLSLKFDKNRGQLTKKQYRNLLTGADLYQHALSAVPFCFVSTDPLRLEVEKTEGVTAHVLPNGISRELEAASRDSKAEKSADEVTIFYGSGTNTHDGDFACLAGALHKLLTDYPQLHLIIVGPVCPDRGLDSFAERIHIIDFLQYESYLQLLAYADINIAPLEPGLFADCKSEIKWMEAGFLGVPSVVTSTTVYKKVINHGHNGFMASSAEQWENILSQLVNEPELRLKIGAQARQSVQQRYGIDALTQRFSELVFKCAQAQFEPLPSSADQKVRLLVVNTKFPPQAMGGATRIAKELIDALKREYPDHYDISVFTCDWAGTKPYALNQYLYDDVVVTSISIPLRPDVDIQHKDDNVRDIFKRFLQYQQPDLIHFHSIQRLTASLLESAEILGLARVVSVHDSWWISDYPFMIDAGGRLVSPNIANPFVASKSSFDVNATLERNRYLRDRLNRVHGLVAVSDYQADLYRKNGFSGIQTIENGVDKITAYEKRSGTDLTLGYVGGKAVHKGYYFLKEVISNASLAKSRLVITDVFSEHDRVRSEKWGNTEVRIYPKYNFDKAGEFYSMIDVLIIPSLWPESFGLALREASLLGIWVVAASAGGMQGALREGRNGFSFDPGDTVRCQEILLELDQNWQKYKQPVEPAVTASLRINSVAQNARETHDLYQRILPSTAQVSREQH